MRTPYRHDSTAQPAVAADRFAREIVGILAVLVVRSRQLNGIPFGGAHRLASVPVALYNLHHSAFRRLAHCRSFHA
jgi:hypothetical protein